MRPVMEWPVIRWVARNRWSQVGAGLALLMVVLVLGLGDRRDLALRITVWFGPVCPTTYPALAVSVLSKRPEGIPLRAILPLTVTADAVLWGASAELLRWSWRRMRWLAFVAGAVIAAWLSFSVVTVALIS